MSLTRLAIRCVPGASALVKNSKLAKAVMNKVISVEEFVLGKVPFSDNPELNVMVNWPSLMFFGGLEEKENWQDLIWMDMEAGSSGVTPDLACPSLFAFAGTAQKLAPVPTTATAKVRKEVRLSPDPLAGPALSPTSRETVEVQAKPQGGVGGFFSGKGVDEEPRGPFAQSSSSANPGREKDRETEKKRQEGSTLTDSDPLPGRLSPDRLQGVSSTEQESTSTHSGPLPGPLSPDRLQGVSSTEQESTSTHSGPLPGPLSPDRLQGVSTAEQGSTSTHSGPLPGPLSPDRLQGVFTAEGGSTLTRLGPLPKRQSPDVTPDPLQTLAQQAHLDEQSQVGDASCSSSGSTKRRSSTGTASTDVTDHTSHAEKGKRVPSFVSCGSAVSIGEPSRAQVSVLSDGGQEATRGDANIAQRHPPSLLSQDRLEVGWNDTKAAAQPSLPSPSRLGDDMRKVGGKDPQRADKPPPLSPSKIPGDVREVGGKDPKTNKTSDHPFPSAVSDESVRPYMQQGLGTTDWSDFPKL
uniref:Uncharacterized protein n=1 Tax=Chromera velia CCMP2878 TaxID=1169474 RepID=A0A0G4I1S6_9ALVE|eukprot:Cvel_1684.t1-p1 / transcript=Cvel_1684.t1 / gene=Cvel_1684 / organism=Chromera_velia_CCMP2878 / gene_product=hypothetical protein / transcript_product=hypothetical protein / location=Cvel_scaffold60:122484-124645(-) / protein_length=521 / sequence_SO=supercontig / SO=protein_coding / is_pseudo=false